MKLSGPIPGENYTSNTKNYPWHRPPEYTDLDKAIEASAKQLMSEEGSVGLLSLIHAGMDLATLTDMFVTSGIGAGKWTPDFALLLAGPVSHIMYLMCKAEGIDCDLGIETQRPLMTRAFFDGVKVEQKKVQTVLDALNDPEVKDAIQDKVGGFMGMGMKIKDQGDVIGTPIAPPQPQPQQPQAQPEQPMGGMQ